MTLSCKPALDYGISELAELMNRSFEEYFVPFNFNAASMAHMLRVDGVDLNASRVVLRDEKPVGLGYIACRGWTSRLAAMGIVLAVRKSGVGKWLMQQLIEEAKSRGERKMVLEVIEQNAPAVKLYQGVGFEVERRLIGFKAQHPVGAENPALQQIDLRQVVQKLFAYSHLDLPWQVAGEALANVGTPFQGFQLDQAYTVISNPLQDTVGIRTLVVEPQAQRQGQATNLLRALFAEFPDKTWMVPIIFPEELAPGLFENLGFEKESLSQYQMGLVLD